MKKKETYSCNQYTKPVGMLFYLDYISRQKDQDIKYRYEFLDLECNTFDLESDLELVKNIIDKGVITPKLMEKIEMQDKTRQIIIQFSDNEGAPIYSYLGGKISFSSTYYHSIECFCEHPNIIDSLFIETFRGLRDKRISFVNGKRMIINNDFHIIFEDNGEGELCGIQFNSEKFGIFIITPVDLKPNLIEKNFNEILSIL
jgi:hypothetical protein